MFLTTTVTRWSPINGDKRPLKGGEEYILNTKNMFEITSITGGSRMYFSEAKTNERFSVGLLESTATVEEIKTSASLGQ